LGIGFGMGAAPVRAGEVTPPAGFVLITDDDGSYLVDDDGAYFVEAA
jgi:hypothetical protein